VHPPAGPFTRLSQGSGKKGAYRLHRGKCALVDSHAPSRGKRPRHIRSGPLVIPCPKNSTRNKLNGNAQGIGLCNAGDAPKASEGTTNSVATEACRHAAPSRRDAFAAHRSYTSMPRHVFAISGAASSSINIAADSRAITSLAALANQRHASDMTNGSQPNFFRFFQAFDAMRLHRVPVYF
jgi:hypothetical protein